MISVQDLDYYYETFTVSALQLQLRAYNFVLLESGSHHYLSNTIAVLSKLPT